MRRARCCANRRDECCANATVKTNRIENCLTFQRGFGGLDLFLSKEVVFESDTTTVFSDWRFADQRKEDNSGFRVKNSCFALEDACVLISDRRELRKTGELSVLIVKMPRGVRDEVLPAGSYLCTVANQ